MLTKQRRAELVLLCVAASWGLTFPLIRDALKDLEPGYFLALRFTLAALVFAPLALLNPRVRCALRREAKIGLLLGGVAFLSYLTQTIGLQTVPAGRAAFITGLNVVIVPLLGPFFGAGRLGARPVLSALLASLGLFLLTSPEAGGLGRGDLWVLGCALAYALYIQLLQHFTEGGERDPVALAFFQVVGLMLCAGLALPLMPGGAFQLSGRVVVAVTFCAVVATVLTFIAQTHFQKDTTATRTAVLFSAEPVFAMIFSWLLLGETIGGLGAIGAGLVMVAILIPPAKASHPDKFDPSPIRVPPTGE